MKENGNRRVLVSACLLGVRCRYNGERKEYPGIERLMDAAQLVPFCPEIYGGLSTPRPAGERLGDRVVTADGGDVTEEYMTGAREALRLAELFGIRYALLKERSPSCGSGEIYDGTFSHARMPGDGVTAQLLKEHGVRVFGETQLSELIDILDGE